MKLHQLQAVVAIAECGSLRSAARQLNAAQPALTRNLAELERELGTAIFERRARGMVPTIPGAAFIRRASSILNEARRAVEEVSQIAGGVSGTVVVSMSMASHILFLTGGLKTFLTRYPHVQLEIVEGVYRELEAEIRNGRIDFYVGPQPPQKIASELVEDLMFPNTRTIICRKRHPLANAKSLSDLTGAEWLALSSTKEGEEEFRGLFARYGLPPPIVRLRGRSALTLIAALQTSDLLALVPVQWRGFAPTKDALQTINVKEALPAPPIVAIRRRALPLTPAATFLLDLFHRKVASLGLQRA